MRACWSGAMLVLLMGEAPTWLRPTASGPPVPPPLPPTPGSVPLVEDFVRFSLVRREKPKRLFFSAMYAPASGSGAAPLMISSSTSQAPPAMRVSSSAQRPKAALRAPGSSPARLVIHTHQKVSSRLKAVMLASSPGSSAESASSPPPPPWLRTCDCELCTRGLSSGGSTLSGGRISVVLPCVPALSSGKPVVRKSAHEGVVGRPRLFLDTGAVRMP